MGPIVGSLLMTACLLAVATGASSASPPPAEVHVDGSVTVDWHPWFRLGLRFRDLAVDRARDRVLLTVSSPDTGGTDLLVRDTRGTVVAANVSLSADPRWVARLAIDSSSGTTFISQLGTFVLKVDTLTGEILDRWNYPFGVRSATVHNGRIYASTDDRPIQILDATTGTVLGNFSMAPFGPYTDLGVDPTGMWVIGVPERGTDSFPSAVRIDITTGTIASLDFRGAFTNSRDGRVFACGGGGAGRLMSFRPENPIVAYHGVPCTGRLEENPVTGVLMDSAGRLLRPEGKVGEVFAPGLFSSSLSTVSFSDFGWRGDGQALVAVRSLSPGTLEVGTWDGVPRLAHQPGVRRVYSERANDLCFFILSVSGMNQSSLHGTLDGGASPIPLDASTSFDCVDVGGLSDGPHVFRALGWDLLAEPLDAYFEFVMDTRSPGIELGSSLSPVDASYELWGWANDSTLKSVSVNGQAAAVSANRWSFRMTLPMGLTEVRVEAFDQAGHSASALYVVHYWPPYRRLAANATGHFSVPIPPGWVDVPSTVPGEGGGVTLFDPTVSLGTAYVRIVSTYDPRAVADPEYALNRTRALESFVESRRGVLLEPAHSVTVANHSGGTLAARVVVDLVAHRFVWIVVVVPEWKRTITVTASVPEAQWSFHENTLRWIVEGFRIDEVPGSTFLEGSGLAMVSIVLVAVVAAGAGLLVVVLLRRRRTRPRP